MGATKIPDSVALSDPLANLLGYQLRRLSVRVMADLGRALAPVDLTPADASVLLMIEANPGITQSELGKALTIQRANMAPLVAGLMARELVSRQPVDGRSNALRLSEPGVRVCREVAGIVAAHEDRLFGVLTGDMRRQLLLDLRALWQAQ